ncbi:MAG: energy-coupling factor ABC transporter ATP-binding protein [Treponema sp.]|jgi:cobalt/nickel transport system ATP-binding protein|nr:energy-coupling factor ABC transporter ATP-binding protein [Treponema sp.]
MVRLVQVSASYQPAATTASVAATGCVLDNISFHIEKGESVAIIGANGAGKTSLFLALAGILPLTHGAIFIDGIALSKRAIKSIRRKIGFVFQNPDDQLFMSRVYDDILFGLLNMGISEEDAQSRAQEALAKLGVGHLAGRSPFRLSGGEKRLCALAATLVMEPEIVFFDEPTAFLDPKSQRMASAVIQALPLTKLIATHDLAFARTLCDRALILRSGSLVADGDPATLFDDAENMSRWGL